MAGLDRAGGSLLLLLLLTLAVNIGQQIQPNQPNPEHKIDGEV